jgi:hypothetical protein
MNLGEFNFLSSLYILFISLLMSSQRIFSSTLWVFSSV